MLKLWKQTGNPPWVQLVNGSVDAHGDHQGILAASLPHQIDYGSEPGSTHVGRACGHALADQMHDITVQLWRQNTQWGQDVVDLFPVPTVTGRRWKNRRGVKLLLMLSAHHCMWLYNMKFLHSSKHNLQSLYICSVSLLITESFCFKPVNDWSQNWWTLTSPPVRRSASQSSRVSSEAQRPRR